MEYVHRLFARAEEELGRLDIRVVNAGVEVVPRPLPSCTGSRSVPRPWIRENLVSARQVCLHSHLYVHSPVFGWLATW